MGGRRTPANMVIVCSFHPNLWAWGLPPMGRHACSVGYKDPRPYMDPICPGHGVPLAV